MKRHDIVEVRGIAQTPFAVVLQSDLYDFLETRLLAPLHPRQYASTIDQVTPMLQFRGEDHVIRIDLIFTVSHRNVGKTVGSAESVQSEINRAIDRLTQGFG